ncbi:iron-containing alcohol dehydrogenase, partial [Clostridioides difficile]|uniref:iron-containing alcohol dehydrogenase n=1 Tax=Clostridioides difficile TaxID=1496 RepID=UPI00114355E9
DENVRVRRERESGIMEMDNGAKDPEDREKMANASTMAGRAFANAFLRVSHSMAHKVGAFHHEPHGVANALMITEVMKFNSTDAPKKMGAFSHYKYTEALKRYAEIASFLGLKGNSDEEKFPRLWVAIEGFNFTVGIPKSIKKFGFDES